MTKRIAHAWMIGMGALALVACDDRTGTGARTNTPNTTTSTTTTPRAADNSANNKGDSDTNAKTPMDQSQSSSDVKITAEIRRAIMEDKAMSTNAQNCKIITEQGVVTLRGVVDSAAEKDSVDAKARAVTGVSRVDNQLEVKTQ